MTPEIRGIGAVAALVASLLPGHRAHAQRRPAMVAITHVDVVPMTDVAVLRDRTVLVRGARIVAVEPAGSVRIPREARVIEGRGRYLIPGLWDMHAHLSGDSMTRALTLPLYVANGITGLRDMVGDCDTLCVDRDSAGFAPPASVVQRWKRDIAAGTLVGPTILSAGNGLDGPNRIFPQTRVIRDSAAAVAAVAEARSRGVDFLKVMGDVPPPAYYVLLRAARAAGLPVAGHLPAGVSPIAAADSGQRSIEHLHGATRQCTSRPDSVNALRAARARDTSSVRRAALTRQITHLYATTFDETACQPYFAALVQHQTWQVPTLAPPHGIGWLDRYDERDDPYAAYATGKLRSEWQPQKDPQYRAMTREDFASTRELFGVLQRIVGAMSRAKVPLLAGSDVFSPHVYPGFGLHDELAYFVGAGMSPRAALEAATVAPARYFGATDTLGTIGVGKRADLVLVNGNPLEDVRNASRVEAVLLGGVVHDRRDLDRLLRLARAYAKTH